MRVVLAVHHFPPRHTGGSERYTACLAAELLRRGYEVRVVCVEHIDRGPPDGVAWEDETWNGIAVRRLSFDLSRAPDRWRWSYDNPWVGAHMAALLREWRADVLDLVGGYLITGSALRAAQALGIPTIGRLADFWFVCPRFTMLRSDGRLSAPPIEAATCARCLGEEQRRYRLPARVAPRLMAAYWRRQRPRIARVQARIDFLRETAARVDAFISPSQFLRTTLGATGFDVSRIDVSQFVTSAPPVTTDKTPSAVLRLGYLGQLTPHKGVHVLIDAVRGLPDAALTLHVFGDTEADAAYTAQLRRRIAGDRRITLCGPYRGGVGAVLRELDVIAVPSLWYENSPMAILEALAHRTPVIASNLGSLPEWVRHRGNGLLFAVGDAEDLARQLQALLSEPALLGALRASIEPVKHAAEGVDEIEVLYRRVCAGRGTAP